MSYVEGFLIPVPAGMKDAYRRMAAMAAPIFREHGALEVVECWSDDIAHGKLTDFYKAVAAEEGENVVFSWIIWPSKEVRDAGNAKVMADERLKGTMESMPFDGKRMIFGGFSVLVDAREQR